MTATIPTDAQPQPATGDAPDNGGQTPAEPTVYRTQDEFDAAFKARLERAKKAWRDEIADELRAQLATEADQARQKEQGEFKPLWEAAEAEKAQLADRVKELEPLHERVERAEAVVARLVDDLKKDAPDYVVDLLKDRDPVEQLDWLTQHRDKWARSTPRGAGPTPPPARDADLTAEQRERAGDQHRQRLKSIF